jgi:hypothetical protein
MEVADVSDEDMVLTTSPWSLLAWTVGATTKVIDDHADLGRYNPSAVAAARIAVALVVPCAAVTNLSFALTLASVTLISFERKQLDTQYFLRMALAVGAATALATARHVLMLGQALGDAPFWLASIVYFGVLVDRVDVAAERRFGAVGKAVWLAVLAAALWLGPDPPVAALLPQPSPFLLLRGWISGYAAARWAELATRAASAQ